MAKTDELVRFDWAIKRLLRHKADHTILNGFLSSLLGEPIKILHMLESEGNRDFEENKSNRVDMLAEDSFGRKILIEVQNETEDSYFHRMLFGTSKIINDYLQKGEKYDNISKVFSINIVFFNLGEGSDYVYKGKTEFYGIHNGSLLELSPKMREKYKIGNVSDIFPEYYILKITDFDKVAVTPLDQWMYFLKHSKLPQNADAPGLKEAEKELKYATLSPEQRKDYEKYIDNMISLEAVMESAWYDGHYEGKAEGRAEGRAEGEREQALKTAKILLREKLPIEIIMKSTGLTEEEIKNIKI